MVKQTQTIHRQIADELFECFGHFVGLALKGLICSISECRIFVISLGEVE